MVDNEELFSEQSGEDTMLKEAINALRLGDQARARDLLTRLLKTDQQNSTYWVWLSAVVDTQKERLYCLQRALEADPENSAARRGLVLLGALPADGSIPPFRIDRPRLWEEKLRVPQEGIEIKRGWANPIVRFFIVLGIVVVVLGGLFLTGTLQLPAGTAQNSTSTRRPTATMSSTVTVTPAFRTATPTFLGATPLAFFLAQTYTPTPLYVVTQHPVITRASFDAGLRSMAAGNFATARIQFQDVLKSEPDAVDVFYYIGESYRLEGNYSRARDAYQQAIEKDITFAPAFLGRARSSLGLDPNADVIADLNAAVKLDPKFAEAYLDRGAYRVESDPAAAKMDLEAALKISPNSAPAYLYLANAELSLGENEAALAAATHANELDMTLVPVYLALARAYIATGQTAQVVSVLHTYTIYMPGDTSAFVQLGTAYNAVEDYEAAVDVLNQAIVTGRNNAEAYYQRGKAYLGLDNPDLAESDFRTAVNMDPLDFDAQLGLARAFFMQSKPGNAWAQVEKQALPLAKTDETKAQAYYWEAIFVEAIGDPTSVAAARNYWNKLMALPADAMPAAWRAEANQHLKVTPTFVPTLSPTRTPTKTTTPNPTRTPTKTLTPALTKAWTATKTPTP